MQKNPTQRYASAEALAEDLERWLRHEPIRARPSSVWEQGVKWAKRHPARAGLVVLALIAPAAIIAVLLVMGAKVTRERDHAQQQEQMTRQNLYAVDVALAWRALDEGDYNLGWRSLAAYRPEFGVPASAGPGPAPASPAPTRPKAELLSELRSFEWRWLWQRAQGEARKTIAAHRSWVNSIAYSPDGRFVASASADGTAKLWDAVQGNLLRTFEEPGNPNPPRIYTDQDSELPRRFMMESASFTPDSRTLLTGCTQALSLWEVESGRALWSLRTDLFSVGECSPTDPSFALAKQVFPRSAMALLDLATGKITTIFTNGRADTVCFTPDGRQFARWDVAARRIWLQTIPSGEILASFATTNMYAQQMAFTPDGRILAACNLLRGPIELFDVAAERSAGQLVGHTSPGHALAISPDGRWLASGGHDQTIRLWDLAARQEVRQLRGHNAAVYALAFSPDSRRLASGGYDGTVRFWDVTPPAPPAPITNVFGAFAFSTDARWLVTQNSRNGVASLWELPSRRLVQEWATPRFQSAVFTTNGVLLTASIGTSNEPPCVRRLPGVAQASSPASSGGVPPPGLSRDGTAALHVEAQPPAVKKSDATFLRGIASPCSAIALSPDGQSTVTGYHDGTVALWETRSGRLLRKAESAFTNSIGYSSRTTGSAINPLVFSQAGQTLAAVSFENVELETWGLPELRPLGGHVFAAKYEVPLAISPDGRQLALGGLKQGLSVNLWDADLRRPGTKLRGHRDFLCAVDYSPDGRTLASGGGDGLLKLWHRATERELGVVLALLSSIQFAQLTFSPDGTWLGASDNTGVLHLFYALPLAEIDRQP